MNGMITALSLLAYLQSIFMPLTDWRDLFFDYQWPYGQAITILIDIDESIFDKHDGHQVLGIINHLFNCRNFWDDHKALLLMETAIKKFPNKSLTKIDAVNRLIEILDDV